MVSKLQNQERSLFDTGTYLKCQVADAELVQRRRAEIASAAAELFARNGYHKTSVQQIARKAKISAGLIYQYVDAKEDVLLLAILYVMERFRKKLEASRACDTPMEHLLVIMDAYCRVVDENKDAAILAYRATMTLPREHRAFVKHAEIATNRLIEMPIKECIATGYFRKADVELAAYQVAIHAHAWALKHWRFRELCSLEQYIVIGWEMLVRALMSEKGRVAYEKILKSRGNEVTGRLWMEKTSARKSRDPVKKEAVVGDAS